MAEKDSKTSTGSVMTARTEGAASEDDTPRSESRGFTGTKDRWGVLITDEFPKYLQLTPEEIALRKEKEAERALKWVKMKKNWPKYCFGGAKYTKLKRRARKGIPDSVRGFAWFQLCGANQVQEKYPNPWAINVSTVSETVIDEVGPIYPHLCQLR